MQGKIVVIGSTNTDMTAFADKMPLPGETVLGNDFVMGPGGQGANQAVAAKRLGGDVFFICKVGYDIFGENTIRHFQEEGLDISGVMKSNKPSGVALITVDRDAENCIVVAPGANCDYSEQDIIRFRDVIEGCDILLMQLEIPVPAVVEAARIGYEKGKTVVLNPAPACELPEEIFKYLTIIVPNENELEKITGQSVTDEKTATVAATSLIDKGVGSVIVTMGSKGSVIFDGGTPVKVEALKVDAVDTTGAGDAYCGALCVALSEGKDLKEAAVFATKASALSVQRSGAQNAMPMRNEIM